MKCIIHLAHLQAIAKLSLTKLAVRNISHAHITKCQNFAQNEH